MATAKKDEELFTRRFEEKYGPGNQFKSEVNDNNLDEDALLAMHPELSQRKAAAASASECYRRSLDQARAEDAVKAKATATEHANAEAMAADATKLPEAPTPTSSSSPASSATSATQLPPATADDDMDGSRMDDGKEQARRSTDEGGHRAGDGDRKVSPVRSRSPKGPLPSPARDRDKSKRSATPRSSPARGEGPDRSLGGQPEP